MQSTIVRAKRSNTDLGIIPELIKLMKPRVMSLVIFTCAVGLLTAPNTVPFVQAVLGIFIVVLLFLGFKYLIGENLPEWLTEAYSFPYLDIIGNILKEILVDENLIDINKE